MKNFGKILGLAGLIMFIFGIIAFALTQANSLFFYVHIFGGLAFLLVYFVLTFRGTKEFLGLMLLLIFGIIGIIISGTLDEKILLFAIPAGFLFLVFLGFNFRAFKEAKKLPYVIVPVILLLPALYAKYQLEKGKLFVILIGWTFVLGISHLILNFKAIREGVFGKSTRYAVNVLVYTFIFLLIVIILNILGYQVDLKKDLTENKVNTLSEQSLSIIKGLKDDIDIMAFMAEKNSVKGMLKELLDLYSSNSKKVKVEFVDPDAKPQVAKQHNAKDGDVVIMAGGEENLVREMTEEAITSAIKKVIRSVKPTICFTSGHGEADLAGNEANGISAVDGGIKNEGYLTKNVASITDRVPEDCDILVVAGPAIPFSRRETQVIGDYLDSGGKGLFMLDPNTPDLKLGGKPYVIESGFEELAEKNGVKLGRNVMIEKHMQLFSGLTPSLDVMANKYATHPIVQSLTGKMTFFPSAVRSVTKTSKDIKATTTELVFSAEGKGISWAETDLAALYAKPQGYAKFEPQRGDIEGPVSIAVSVEKDALKPAKSPAAGETEDPKAKKREKTREVWVGNSMFVFNGYIRSYEFNFDLFLNILNWMWGEEDKISIRPKTLRTSALILSPEQSNIIFYISVLLIPEVILLSGLVIWIRRRKR